MNRNAENPYAPPSGEPLDETQDTPGPKRWWIENGCVWVKPRAVFPKLDLHTGEIHDRMTLLWTKVACRPGFFVQVWVETRFIERRKNLLKALNVLFLLGAFPLVFGLQIPAWLKWPCAALLGVWLLGCLMLFFTRRRLSCRQRRGETFELKGGHPLAVQKLAAMAK